MCVEIGRMLGPVAFDGDGERADLRITGGLYDAAKCSNLLTCGRAIVDRDAIFSLWRLFELPSERACNQVST